MILKAIIDDQIYELNVPDALLSQGRGFFDKLDQDMDGGWQMSREWVRRPDRLQRCQIVADKLLTALESENYRLGRLMAGYLLTRLPGLESVELDIQGEIQNNQFNMGTHPPPGEAGPDPVRRHGQSKLEALESAGNDVTQVFKVGKGYRFSVFDHASGGWKDSPLFATRDEASRMRQDVFRTRYEALTRDAPE